MNEMLQACLDAAAEIVAREKALYPNSEGVVAFNAEISGGTTDTSFSRTGDSTQAKSYSLPGDLAAQIEQNYKTAGVPTSLTDSELSFIQGILTLVQSALPGQSVLQNNQAISPTTFNGSGTLGSIIAQNPYSAEWEAGTQALYDRTLDVARARTLSGPENVRGGQARAGFELADTNTQAGINRFQQIEGQQRQQAGVVDEAVKTANVIEQARRGTAMQAQGQEIATGNQWRGQGFDASGRLVPHRANALGQTAMATEFLSTPTVKTTDNLRGKGNQSTFNWGTGAGISCCWIFLAAHGGGLPWWVRYCRNHLGTNETRRGYRRMARWLVPLMERWALVRVLVHAFMTYPITCYGGFLVHEPGYETGFVFRPVKRFWFYVWNKLGKA